MAHRDIKPDNILIHPKTLDVKFIDFGMAQTKTAQSTAGTVYYQPPEYLGPQVDFRLEEMQQADIWSLGLTIYRLLAREDYTVLWYTHDFWPNHKSEFISASQTEQQAYQYWHTQAIRHFLKDSRPKNWTRYLPPNFLQKHADVFATMLQMLAVKPECRRMVPL